MASVSYMIQSGKDPAGIYVRLKDGRFLDIKVRTRFIISRPLFQKNKAWIEGNLQPKLKDERLKRLSADLFDLKNRILSDYSQVADVRKVDTLWLKQFINPVAEAESIPDGLLEYFDYYALHKKGTIAASTHTKLQGIRTLLEKFEKRNGRKFYVSDVNNEFQLKLEQFLREDSYAQNTTARLVKFVKTICYHARKNGISTHFQLDGLASKNEKVEKTYLTPKEISKIESSHFSDDYLDNARDWLLISCETGQRVSDFMRFTSAMIRKQGEVTLLEFTQVKTGKLMSIPLSRKVQGILQKRKGNFPRKISDQRYNEYIKTVCEYSGIDQMVSGSKIDKKTNRKTSGVFPKYELVTSHIGRRTFATNYYGTVPTALLISATGHSTETMFLEYIGKSVTDKALQLANFLN